MIKRLWERYKEKQFNKARRNLYGPKSKTTRPKSGIRRILHRD